eukprot:761404-Hanusia_phi.AAC.2
MLLAAPPATPVAPSKILLSLVASLCHQVALQSYLTAIPSLSLPLSYPLSPLPPSLSLSVDIHSPSSLLPPPSSLLPFPPPLSPPAKFHVHGRFLSSLPSSLPTPGSSESWRRKARESEVTRRAGVTEPSYDSVIRQTVEPGACHSHVSPPRLSELRVPVPHPIARQRPGNRRRTGPPLPGAVPGPGRPGPGVWSLPQSLRRAAGYGEAGGGGTRDGERQSRPTSSSSEEQTLCSPAQASLLSRCSRCHGGDCVALECEALRSLGASPGIPSCRSPLPCSLICCPPWPEHFRTACEL